MPPPAHELEEFFDLSLDLLCVVGFDGCIKRANPALERTLGYPRGELVSRSALEIIHPDDAGLAREALARLTAGQDLVGFEARVVCADGSIRALEWNTRSLPERGVIYGVAREVTERAALVRVATLVASGAPPEDVFVAVAREAGILLGADGARVMRYLGDEADQLAGWTAPGYPPLPVGRIHREDATITGDVFRSGGPVRIDEYPENVGRLPDAVRALGIQSAVGAPIFVGGRLWGALAVWLMHAARLPDNTEVRLAAFTELVATAIAQSANREELDRVLAEQAALRRVATLIAREAEPDAVFAAVAEEVGQVLGADAAHIGRYDPDGTVVSLAQWGRYVGVPIGERSPLEGDIAAPVVVEGRTWGVLAALWDGAGRPPEGTEARLGRFADLLGTAIANADGRAALTASRARVLVAGDAARRRVVRDLHDGAQQRLVQMILEIKLALREDDGDAKAALAQALDTAERATAELRELAHGILPAALTSGGIRYAIDAMVSRLDLPVDVDVTSERLAPEVEANAYFIVAEAITNVIKHARATRATVTAAVTDGVLEIEVRDDGRGGADPQGHGLMGLADRVAALGGRLQIESGAAGTVLDARLPLL